VTIKQEQQFLYLTTKGWKTGRTIEVDTFMLAQHLTSNDFFGTK
jgi:hypothetical protein